MFHTPRHPLLIDRIVCYWLIEAESIPAQTKMLPDGHSDIMLNAGEPYVVVRPDGTRETLIAEAGFSYKQAERAFRKHLGLTPKRYARIVRFHYAFTQVRGKEAADWMDVLLRCGYYDQSHFIRDFRLFAGLPPGKSHAVKDTLDAFFGFA